MVSLTARFPQKNIAVTAISTLKFSIFISSLLCSARIQVNGDCLEGVSRKHGNGLVLVSHCLTGNSLFEERENNFRALAFVAFTKLPLVTVSVWGRVWIYQPYQVPRGPLVNSIDYRGVSHFLKRECDLAELRSFHFC